jgi:hypothetical protein
MKEKDCKTNQIFNEKTKRCINKDTKQAIEILFNQKNKTILNLYEIIDGKIVKKCEKPKIRNLETKRCVKPKDETIIAPKKKTILKDEKKIVPKKKTILKDETITAPKKKTILKDEIKLFSKNSLEKKIEAINKVKKALTPFKNRVSANIYHRNKYLVLMRRELKNRKDGCIRIYKKNADGSISYRIGNRIILKQRIGSNSVYGIVYLSEFREKDKKLFTFASKIYEFKNTRATMELEILNKLTNVVRMDKCPHFPIFYGYVICEKFLDFKKDSFEKSKSIDKTVSQRLEKFPELVQEKKRSILITTFIELANGDLWKFFRAYGNNSIYLINALIQQLLSIMFFNYHTNRIHFDTHPGNFLYHKIKAGGYFHYELFGFNYYLENIGILWVIWDFDLSITTTQAIQQYNLPKNNGNDYNRVLKAYISDNTKYGFNPYPEIEDNKELQEYMMKIHRSFNLFYNYKVYDIDKLINFINKIPSILSSVKYDGNPILLRELPKGEKIINKNPYKIDKLFK